MSKKKSKVTTLPAEREEKLRPAVHGLYLTEVRRSAAPEYRTDGRGEYPYLVAVSMDDLGKDECACVASVNEEKHAASADKKGSVSKNKAAVIADKTASDATEKANTENNITSQTEARPDAHKQMKERDVNEISKKQRIGKIFVQIALYTFLTVIAITVIFPFYWMLISSFKTMAEYEATIPTFWPHEFQWSNYSVPFTGELHLGRLFLNTCYVGIFSTILSLVITVLSAYAFAKMEFRGKNVMFALMLATMMIPGELFTVTNYVTVSQLGWTNSFTALIVPFLVSVFYIYLLRQNFLQIPNELYLAAKVDGTSDLKYLWKVMIPLAAPTLISITILKMMGAWNSYVWPNLVANDLKHRLITVGLRGEAFYDDILKTTNMPAQMAAVVLVTIPLLLVFMFFRKYIMHGVSRSGIKG